MAMCEFDARRMRDMYLPIDEKRIPAKVWRWAEKNAQPLCTMWAVWLEPLNICMQENQKPEKRAA